ncbi:MAG: polysaccharide deacetylase family protein [Pseudomonadota bacterium]
MSKLTFTFDLEDPSQDQKAERVLEPTQKVLELLEAASVVGTFFVVAKTASKLPQLIRQIHEKGHEVALHSLDHTEIVNQNKHQFSRATAQGKAIVEDIINHPVTGYRAPNFSLTSSSPWASDVLADLEFTYSSSILPTSHIFHGYPDAPAVPFRWASGLIEFPAPVTQLLFRTVPFLGGIYFRYLPFTFVIKRSQQSTAPWFYCHPYDFDPQQPYYRLHNTDHWASLLLWFNRGGSLAKLQKLLHHPTINFGPSFASQVQQLESFSLPEFTPG